MATTLEQLQYGFDRDSRRTWRQRATTQGWDNAYVYDSLSQVIGDDRGDLNQAHNAIAGIPANGSRWQYDEAGNWHGYQTLGAGAATLTQSRTHDKGNRLMEVSDAAAMRTDRAGRMLETAPGPAGDWGSGYEITWDAWSRITAVASLEEGGATPVAAYGYDGLTRRITRYTNAEDVTLHSYYNGEWRPLEDRKDSETTVAASFLWGARHRDDLVRRDRAVGVTTLNETRYILMDYFSPAAITDEAGEVTERYQFSAFGLRTILSPDFTVRSDSECAMEFSFQGQFADKETGWLNYGYRYYLAALGRWARKDPIGIDGGPNLYGAVRNDPVNRVDHLGLIEYNFDESACILKVKVKWKLTFGHYDGATGKFSAGGGWTAPEEQQWKQQAESAVESYYSDLEKSCTPNDKCCPCQKGVEVELDLQYVDSDADMDVKVSDTSWHRGSAMTPTKGWFDKDDTSPARTGVRTSQTPIVHEMGHGLGLNHPGHDSNPPAEPNSDADYDADPKSLMGRGMELRPKDQDKAFCSKIKPSGKTARPCTYSAQ